MAAPAEPTATTTPSLIPDSQPLSSQLDNEIATIRAQITTLTHHRSLLRSTLLSSKPTQSLLNHFLNPSSQTPATTTTTPALHHATTHQAAHNTLTLHRLCAGATMFRVRDPDPHALDSGRVYGVRIEVFCEGKFLTPYYLLLHRPYADSAALRVHRHTVPPCIPLSALVARWLPLPKTPAARGGGGDAEGNVEAIKGGRKRALRQDLPRLVREVRREIVGWHLRGAWVGRVRGACGLETRGGAAGERMAGTRQGREGIKEIEAMDAEGMDIRIRWENGRIGRMRVDKGGRVERAVVVGEKGRERAVERVIVGGKGKGEGRLEGLGWRLLEVAGVA